MKCYCCGKEIPANVQSCPVCGLTYPRIAGDKAAYEAMMQEIAGEYREKNKILLDLLDRMDKMEEELALLKDGMSRVQPSSSLSKNPDKKGFPAENVKKGSVIQFGRYPQNQKADSTAEPIDWIVLAKEDGRALLLSKYGMDCKPYNTRMKKVTWDISSLRTWLNGSFMTTAFTAEEQGYIRTTRVTAEANPAYSTNPGNDTDDRVFLLSSKEVDKYFGSNSERKCYVTAYAKAQGAYSSSEGTCWWWLRSPGFNDDNAAYVYYDGSVYYCGNNVNYDDGSVRPALWINLES